VKKVVEKIKEERAEREREFSFFCFSFKIGVVFLNWAASKKIHSSIQLNSLFNFHKIHSSITLCCYFSVKAKSEYAHHQTKSTQKEKEFI